MNDEINTAQTNEATDGAGADGAVSQHAGADDNKPDANANDAVFTDAAGQDDGSDAAKEDEKKKASEQNAQNARRRREAERQKELADARVKAIIEAVGENPFTGEEIKDAHDVEEYLAMKEIQRDGGDPLRDFARHKKEKERKTREAAEKAEAENEWFRQDGAAFAEKYPDVDLKALIKNPDFAEYADGKIGSRPLAEIYESYMGLSERIRKQADDRAAQALANKNATPGALSHGKTNEKTFFTKEEVDAMSQADVKKHYDEIRSSMKQWR